MLLVVYLVLIFCRVVTHDAITAIHEAILTTKIRRDLLERQFSMVGAYRRHQKDRHSERRF